LLDIPKSSVHRILQTLIDRQLVREDADLEKYSLGIGILRLSQSVLAGIDIRQQARPVLENLSLTTDETVHLAILDDQGPMVIYIDKIESSRAVRLVSQVGQSVPVHCTALGKALLSCRERTEVDALLTNYSFIAFTPNTIVNLELLLDQLEIVREQGYAIDNIEYEQSVVCVASPIKNKDGLAVAAVSISVPGGRLRSEDIPSVGTKVKIAADEISEIICLMS